MTPPQYLVVFEKAGKNYSAYAPDLPGCVATGKTAAAARAAMRAAIGMHVAGLREDGLPVPKPAARSARIGPSGREARPSFRGRRSAA